MDNQVIGSRAGFEDDAETAIMASDTSPLFGEITVRGNLVKDGPGCLIDFYLDEPGVKTITITVENELGSVTETFQITISDPAQGETAIYLPKLAK